MQGILAWHFRDEHATMHHAGWKQAHQNLVLVAILAAASKANAGSVLT